MKKRLATPGEKDRFRIFLLDNGCPLDYVDQIISDYPFVIETEQGIEFSHGKPKKEFKGFGKPPQND